MDRLSSLHTSVLDLATNPKHTAWISPALWLLDGTLTAFIVKKIQCKLDFHENQSSWHDRAEVAPLTYGALDTEIDWVAYMQQIALYRSGERDYANIKGQTGKALWQAKQHQR